MKTTRLILATIATGLVAALQPATAADPPAPKADAPKVTYATDIKAILDATCVRCHNSEKAKAGVQLDSLASVLKGTTKRKLVEPGKSADSLLVKILDSIAAAAKDPEGKTKALHKKGPKPLTPEEIGKVKAWIDQGAK